MVIEAKQFERLVSKRDHLLEKNIDKGVELVKANLRKEMRNKIKEGEKKKLSKEKIVREKKKSVRTQKPLHLKKKVLQKSLVEKKKPVKKSLTSRTSGKKFLTVPEIKKQSKISEISKSQILRPKKQKVNAHKSKLSLLREKVPTQSEILKKEREINFEVSKKQKQRIKKEAPKKQLKVKKPVSIKKPIKTPKLLVSSPEPLAVKKQKFVEKKPKKISHEKLRKKIIRDSERRGVPKVSHEIKEIAEIISKLKKEIAKVVVGQEEVINAFICALLCDGHVLLEGVPGIAKTLIIKTLAKASGCSSKRVQFTVDLLPSDIVGITTYTPQKGFEIIKGPIFANFIVADEINRSPPKTQSALIEAMQEKQVTIGKETFKLPLPFFVMANNNPIEVSGVYTLPEAQIDRFLFKLVIEYPDNEEEKRIMEDNITIKKFEDFDIKAILSPEKIIKMQKLTKKIYIDEKIKDYIVRIVDKTRKRDFENGQYIEWGGSPRANIGLFIASKAWALMHGRDYVVPKDVKDIAHYVLRHRIILNYRAKAEKLTSDNIIDEILDMIEV